MLRGLEIRDILIIERLELEFQAGLNVLTGETGAGKSILLDALGFVLGWRGRADLIRAGAEHGEVVASFDLSVGHTAHAILEDAGLPVSDELILRRVNRGDGRKTAWVNDRRVSGDVLRRLSETLVEVQGQHDDRGLLNARGHRDLLDAYAETGDAVAAVRAAWSDRKQIQSELNTARERIEGLRTEEEFLRHSVSELDALAPEPGEEADLDARRRLMQGAERVRADIARAHAALSLEGAEGMLSDAARWLEGSAGSVEGRLDAPLDALGRAMEALGDAEQGVADCLDALSFDPRELEDVEERLFAIRGLARKHGVLPDDLARFADDLRSRLSVLDAGSGDLASLEQKLDRVSRAHTAACVALSDKRKQAALRLDKAMAVELAPLKMERAVFTTQFSDAEPGSDGCDVVNFTVATNPGAPAGPLDKIASGGELSRFLLALKVCLTGAGQGVTLIFDEIDRGVGGATADAVGRRLSELANGGQVLVVTHSPQVAARGDHHWRVEKHVSGEQTLSTVTALGDEEREDEVARMLSGDTVTDEARSAARSLLDG